MSMARKATLLLLLLLGFLSKSSSHGIVTNNNNTTAGSATTSNIALPSLLLMSSTTITVMKDNESSSISGDQPNSNGTDNNVIEDYDYNVDESLVTYDWAQLIPPVVVYSIVLLVGIFGNGILSHQLILMCY